MLNAMKLPIKFWAEAILVAVYLPYISHIKAVWNKTPHEACRFGVKTRVVHLRVFGCLAYLLIPAQNLQKLDNKAMKGIFIDYCSDAKAYRIYNPVTEKIFISRDVHFDEGKCWNQASTYSSRQNVVIQLTKSRNSRN